MNGEIEEHVTDRKESRISLGCTAVGYSIPHEQIQGTEHKRERGTRGGSWVLKWGEVHVTAKN